MLLSTAQPFDGAAVLRFLAARAIDGVETVEGGTYRRTLALPGGPAMIALTPRADGVDAEWSLADPADEPRAIATARALFGLDEDPAAVVRALGDDPILGPLVRARPGLRVPGAASGFEVAVRAVAGQQISVAAARRLLSRLTAAAGERSGDDGALSLLFPKPSALAAAPDEAFRMPRNRARTLRELALADPPLATPDDAAPLTQLYGIGPWTAGYVALRLGDPDVFLDGDVAVRTSLTRLGATTADAQRWAPFRSQAVLHLWANLAKAAV
ncbi:DNA-3-methyladenine glycosylase family protein [Baekduia sp. Peel2402]|uniref:DNA-3-methyladenine glycosylase family protein n=1 Tax=Baekduia sp. Peel2402 TaxID=3458296 RepID=UPI00403E6D5C